MSDDTRLPSILSAFTWVGTSTEDQDESGGRYELKLLAKHQPTSTPLPSRGIDIDPGHWAREREMGRMVSTTHGFRRGWKNPSGVVTAMLHFPTPVTHRQIIAGRRLHAPALAAAGCLPSIRPSPSQADVPRHPLSGDASLAAVVGWRLGGYRRYPPRKSLPLNLLFSGR